MTKAGLLGLVLLAATLASGGVSAQAVRDQTDILRQLAPTAAADTARPRSIDLDIAFAINSAELLPGAARQLDELAAALRSPTLSGAEVVIAGHTDASGSADLNRKLSERRAESVKTYLVDRHRLDPRRLKATGHGADRPKLPFDPRNPANRRVEIAVAGGDGGPGVARPVR